MKQKLAVISALLHEPKLLVMDEPFVGLDPGAAHLLKERMRELCGRGGDFPRRMCSRWRRSSADRVAIIRQAARPRRDDGAGARRPVARVGLSELEGGHA